MATSWRETRAARRKSSSPVGRQGWTISFGRPLVEQHTQLDGTDGLFAPIECAVSKICNTVLYYKQERLTGGVTPMVCPEASVLYSIVLPVVHGHTQCGWHCMVFLVGVAAKYSVA